MKGLNINLFGGYGIAGIMFLSGAYIFKDSSGAAGGLFAIASIISIAVLVFDMYHKDKKLTAQIKGYL